MHFQFHSGFAHDGKPSCAAPIFNRFRIVLSGWNYMAAPQVAPLG